MCSFDHEFNIIIYIEFISPPPSLETTVKDYARFYKYNKKYK